MERALAIIIKPLYFYKAESLLGERFTAESAEKTPGEISSASSVVNKYYPAHRT